MKKESKMQQNQVIKKYIEKALNTDEMVMRLQRFNPAGGLDALAGYPRRFRVTLHVQQDDVNVREIVALDYLSDEDEFQDSYRCAPDYRNMYGMDYPPGLGPYGPRLAQAGAERLQRARTAQQLKKNWMNQEVSSDSNSDSDEDDQFFRPSRRRGMMGMMGYGYGAGPMPGPMMGPMGPPGPMAGPLNYGPGMYDDMYDLDLSGIDYPAYGAPYRRYGGMSRRCRSGSPVTMRTHRHASPLSNANYQRTSTVVQPFGDGTAPVRSGVSRLVAPLQPITPTMGGGGGGSAPAKK